MRDSFYEITQFRTNQAPDRTVLTISMDQADWCEFEGTALYQELIKYLDHLENRR